MSSTSSNYKLIEPTVSGDSDVWGGYLNTTITSIDKLLTAIATTGSANAYLLTTGQSLTAYTTGMCFRIIPNFTNSGACTINVDGIGAKNLYRYSDGALAACVSGDVVSGVPISIAYDGTQFVISSAGIVSATLRAIDAVSWSSGSPVLQWTAADTVSLTNTPTFTSTAAATAAATIKNTTDNAAVAGLNIVGARATPAASDAAYVSFTLNNASSAAKEFMRLQGSAATVTAGSESGQIQVLVMSSGVLTSTFIGSPSTWCPTTNDVPSLGTATQSWSDLFLATGGVINWNNGTFTLTQSSTNLAASGSIQARVPLSSETTGTLTTASANKKVACSGGITIPNSVFTADDFVLFDAGASSRTFTRSSTNMYVSGTDSASATLAANQMGTCHFRSATAAVLSGAFS